jgi:hypothetical protein
MEFGLWVRVLDASTGLPAACGAIVWITDGAYVDTLEYRGGCSYPESVQTGYVLGAQERVGRYEVFVEKPGYQSWHATNVVVVRQWCHCHVRRTTIEARLRPL